MSDCSFWRDGTCVETGTDCTCQCASGCGYDSLIQETEGLKCEIERLNQELAVYKEKDTPKHPVIKEWEPALCPHCKAELSEHKGDGYYKHYYSLKICECGQKLKWD